MMDRSQLTLIGFSLSIFFGASFILSCDRSVLGIEAPKVVRTYCVGCHLTPDPKSLTKQMWAESVLPAMSEYFVWTAPSKYPYANSSISNQRAKYQITDEEWTSILDFYVQNGLEDVNIRNSDEWPIQKHFDEIPISLSAGVPDVTAITITQSNDLFVGSSGTLLKINDQFTLDRSVFIGSEITHIYDYSPSELYVVSSRTIDPHEGPYGKVDMLNTEQDSFQTIIEQLRRPVQVFKDDNELFVSQFGFYTGKFTRHDIDSNFQSEAIHNLPGTYRIRKMKLYKNQPEQLVISLSQAQEGVFVIEQIKSGYRLSPLVRYGPEHGLSDMDIYDLNGDGLDDLLTANGDNADSSVQPKDYHGIRVYVNKGKRNFEEIYSLPLYGATQARFVDINADGNMDILASCYFAEHRSRRLVALINMGDNIQFQTHQFNLGHTGRWMVLETGDIDGDGDSDAVLGAYEKGPMANQSQNPQTSNDLLVLRNNAVR